MVSHDIRTMEWSAGKAWNRMALAKGGSISECFSGGSPLRGLKNAESSPACFKEAALNPREHRKTTRNVFAKNMLPEPRASGALFLGMVMWVT